MTTDVYLRGKRIKLDPTQSLGKGGEADVFRLGADRALKLFKPPDHPDYAGMPAEQAAAERRLQQHQRKLREFPTGLPAQVVAPEELATDRSGRVILGYTMRLVAPATLLVRYADPAFRRAGVPNGSVVALFRDMLRTLSALHAAGVVVGDFNDLNVLVTPDEEARFIDADSYQFGTWPCAVFTERFVDPLLCDPAATSLRLVRPYQASSDWYAFAALLLQSLLFVGPYGGIYRPGDPSRRVPQGERPLRRITVFSPEVVYPKPATSFRVLPDDLLHFMSGVFERDVRGPFPPALLEALTFTRCSGCGVEHARSSCPLCRPSETAQVAETITVRGTVRARRLFETGGVIVHAVSERGVLRLVHHDAGAYRREDGAELLRGPLDRSLIFRILGPTTVVGRGGELAVLSPGRPTERLTVDSDGTGPAFDTNGRYRYWASEGRLVRSVAAPLHTGEVEPLGDVLLGQTRIWAGPTFGLGLYRASNLSVLFSFDAERRGINDTLRLPPLRGVLVDAACVLDETRAWLLLAIRAGGKTLHRCVAYGRGGVLEGMAEAEAGDNSWLGTLRGKCATRGVLLAATDTGLARIEVQGGDLTEARHFPDAVPFVDSECQLLAGKEGLMVVGARTVTTLTMN
jgi:hypothetical protein